MADRHINRYHVIFVDMNSVSALFASYSSRQHKIPGVTDMVDFLEYSLIREFRRAELFARCLEEEGTENTGLLDVLTVIRSELQIKFIFIMDEWDLLFREYRDDERLQMNFLRLLKGLFKTAPGLSCFHLAYLTGILPIKKYNSQSALNGFDEFNLLSPGNWAPYFGFTADDVQRLCQSPFCRLSLEQIREWYDGYVIGGEHIFNPYSVCRAVIRNECIGHWIGTSSNEEAARLIGMPFPGLQEDILNLAAGGRITFDSGSFQNDMDTQENKDQILALLVCLGYLGCTCETASCHSACVPNREIRYALCSMVRRQPWFAGHQVTERSDRLFRAITSMDAATAGEILGSIHNSSYVSHLGYNSREALGFCKASGLLWTSEVIYDIRQELSSGRGWLDMVFLPRISTLPVMIFEFKRDSTATDALKKIREQGYAERYSRGGVDESVLLIGLA